MNVTSSMPSSGTPDPHSKHRYDLIVAARKVRQKAEADLGPIEPGQRVDLLADNISFAQSLDELREVAAIIWADAHSMQLVTEDLDQKRIRHQVTMDDTTRTRLLGMLEVEVTCVDEFIFHEKSPAQRALLQADLVILRRAQAQLKAWREVTS